MYRTYLNIMH